LHSICEFESIKSAFTICSDMWPQPGSSEGFFFLNPLLNDLGIIYLSKTT